MKRYAGFKLLIVDDHEHNLFTLRSLIQRYMDVEIFEATSGQQALDIAVKEPGIDLIILDVQMPEMDGFEFLRELRAMEGGYAIPVVVVTAKTLTQEDRVRLNDYVTTVLQKDAYARDDLVEEVAKLVRGVRGADTGGPTG